MMLKNFGQMEQFVREQSGKKHSPRRMTPMLLAR